MPRLNPGLWAISSADVFQSVIPKGAGRKILLNPYGFCQLLEKVVPKRLLALRAFALLSFEG